MSRRAVLAAIMATASCAASLMGCATGMIPTPKSIAATPLGTEAIKLGMPKTQVESLWGKPDAIRFEEGSDTVRGKREIWYYAAQYSAIVPRVNAGYLSQSRQLYFDGDNLVEIR